MLSPEDKTINGCLCVLQALRLMRPELRLISAPGLEAQCWEIRNALRTAEAYCKTVLEKLRPDLGIRRNNCACCHKHQEQCKCGWEDEE